MNKARGALSATGLGIRIGTLPPGPNNAITDVRGVAVGHCTVTDDSNPAIQTGVTVILPHQGNPFVHKVVAGCHVINGYGKSTGLVQINELGYLESPIGLTNTFSIPAVTEGLLDHILKDNPAVGDTMTSVNTVVAECNDSRLNDMRGRHVRPRHVRSALEAASMGPVPQGAVGAGRGMSAFGLKGGIGTASRVVGDSETWTVGVLVLSNFCQLKELVIAGRPVGRRLASERREEQQPGAGGSIIVVVGTDALISDRQLTRLLRRVQNGLARTGSSTSHNSGEIAIGFVTHAEASGSATTRGPDWWHVEDDSPLLDLLFQAVGDATEEAVLNSLFNATTVTGKRGAQSEGFPIDRIDELMAPAAQP
ncbi:MAG: P1 family peptidase [Candidatus Dormiibacterota bacterium]